MWTTPATFTVGQLVTATDLNTQVRDNMLALMHPLDYSTTDVEVAGTVTETSMWSKTITGGSMGTTGTVRVDLYSDILYNRIAGDTITMRLKFGAATVITHVISSSSTNATRDAHHFVFVIANLGAANSQHVIGEILPNHPGGISFRGYDEQLNQSTIDTASDQTLQVTAQLGNNGANLAFRKRLVIMRLGRN